MITTSTIVILWILAGCFFLFLTKLVEDDKIILRTYEDLAFIIIRFLLFTGMGPLSIALFIFLASENQKWKRKKLPWIKEDNE